MPSNLRGKKSEMNTKSHTMLSGNLIREEQSFLEPVEIRVSKWCNIFAGWPVFVGLARIYYVA